MDNEETESSTPDYMDVLKRIHIRYIPDLRSLRFFLSAMHVTSTPVKRLYTRFIFI
ncbi:hypothetical protein BKA69DRAFT_1047108, partial [Paraphysoderma sedebokerense]